MKQPKFELSDHVRLSLSDEHGIVIGKAVYVNSDPSYLIRYKAGDGRQVENWQPEDALALAAG
jgi:hypothetical protein